MTIETDTKKTGQGSNFYKPATSGETPSELAARRKKLKRAAGRMPQTAASSADEGDHPAGRSLGRMSPRKSAAGDDETYTEAFEAGYEAGVADIKAAVDEYSQRVEALVAGLVQRHAAELRATAPDLEPRPVLDAKAVERIVEERVALASPQRQRKEAGRSTPEAFGSFEALEAAMNGQSPVVRREGPGSPPKRLFGF